MFAYIYYYEFIILCVSPITFFFELQHTPIQIKCELDVYVLYVFDTILDDFIRNYVLEFEIIVHFYRLLYFLTVNACSYRCYIARCW